MSLEGYKNLKEKKKTVILDAISNCLKKASYDDLSVNDIVVEADISRGSFYNYFADKNDAVMTLVDSKLHNHFERFREMIIECNNKLFDGVAKLYSEISEILKDEKNLIVFKNIQFFVEFGLKVIHSKKYESYINNMLDWLIQNTDEGKTYLNNRKKMTNVFNMLLSLLATNLFSRLVLNSESFKKYDDFEYKLNIIKKGTNSTL